MASTGEVPFAGRHILVTRPRGQETHLVDRLRELGAEVRVWHALEILPPEDWSAVDQTLAHLADYQWIVFTSANGVEWFFRRLDERGINRNSLSTIRFAAVGPATARASSHQGCPPAIVPRHHRAEMLAEEMAPLVHGTKVLFPRADRGRDVLIRALSQVAQIDCVIVYRQIDVPGAPDLTGVSDVIVTSPHSARVLLSRLDALADQAIRNREIQLVSISPLTSAAIIKHGFPVAIEATRAADEGIIEAMIQSRSRKAL